MASLPPHKRWTEKEHGGSAGASPPADTAPLTDTAVAVIFAGLAVLLVLGYLFVNKLMDMSQEEDCMLGHRANCAGTGVELKR